MMDLKCITEKDKRSLFAHFPEGIISFDAEFTGLSPLFDHLIELSAVKITPNSVEIFDQLINPNVPILNSAFHGIDDQMVQSAPIVEDVLTDFKSFCENTPLLAHNARFDIGFLVYHSFLSEIEIGENEIYDSCHYARHAFKKETSKFGLGNISKHLNISLINHHRALDDSLAALRVFIRSIQKEESKNVASSLIKKHSFFLKLSDFHPPIHSLPKHLHLLQEKVKSQKEVLIKYNGGSKKNEYRLIKPISLLPLPTGNVLYALCIESDIYKNYIINKISSVKEIEANDL